MIVPQLQAKENEKEELLDQAATQAEDGRQTPTGKRKLVLRATKTPSPAPSPVHMLQETHPEPEEVPQQPKAGFIFVHTLLVLKANGHLIQALPTFQQIPDVC